MFFHLDGQLIESPTLKIFLFISVMCDLVARTGRLQQRYEDGSRLVAGYRFFIHPCSFFFLLCLRLYRLFEADVLVYVM